LDTNPGTSFDVVTSDATELVHRRHWLKRTFAARRRKSAGPLEGLGGRLKSRDELDEFLQDG
jgi:hypothetical protein